MLFCLNSISYSHKDCWTFRISIQTISDLFFFLYCMLSSDTCTILPSIVMFETGKHQWFNFFYHSLMITNHVSNNLSVALKIDWIDIYTNSPQLTNLIAYNYKNIYIFFNSLKNAFLFNSLKKKKRILKYPSSSHNSSFVQSRLYCSLFYTASKFYWV